MEESEQHFRLEIAKGANSHSSPTGRELVSAAPRELELVQDGRFYHLAVNDHGQFTFGGPPRRHIFGKVLLAIAFLVFLSSVAYILIDYVNLKLATRPMPPVLAGRAEAPPPAVLGSTQNGRETALLAPLPATYDAPRPTLDFASPPASAIAKTTTADSATTASADSTSTPVPAAIPTGRRQIPLSRGFGTVEEVTDDSPKYLVRPDGP